MDILNKDKEDLIQQARRMDEQNDAQKIRILQKDNAQVSSYENVFLDLINSYVVFVLAGIQSGRKSMFFFAAERSYLINSYSNSSCTSCYESDSTIL